LVLLLLLFALPLIYCARTRAETGKSAAQLSLPMALSTCSHSEQGSRKQASEDGSRFLFDRLPACIMFLPE
jgi:hypothetical protein